jgi:hypothetical protein
MREDQVASNVVALRKRADNPLNDRLALIGEARTFIEWGKDSLDSTRYIKELIGRLADALEGGK